MQRAILRQKRVTRMMPFGFSFEPGVSRPLPLTGERLVVDEFEAFVRCETFSPLSREDARLAVALREQSVCYAHGLREALCTDHGTVAKRRAVHHAGIELDFASAIEHRAPPGVERIVGLQGRYDRDRDLHGRGPGLQLGAPPFEGLLQPVTMSGAGLIGNIPGPAMNEQTRSIRSRKCSAVQREVSHGHWERFVVRIVEVKLLLRYKTSDKMHTLSKVALFRFYGDLNDFLPAPHRQSKLPYRFWGQPAVKDAIEAIGVPHPEVFYVQNGGTPIGLDHTLTDGDRISVYPQMRNVHPAAGWLRPLPPTPPRFVLDAHLGKLARYLRMLGLDTSYQNDAKDPVLARIAHEERRILLTRDLGLLKRSRVIHGAFVRATDPKAQLHEIFQRYALDAHLDPLTRCLRCNGPIEPVAKNAVRDELPPKTRQHFDTFYRCASCDHVYWKGSHYERMRQFIARFTA